jgi:hypothetical protein
MGLAAQESAMRGESVRLSGDPFRAAVSMLAEAEGTRGRAAV